MNQEELRLKVTNLLVTDYSFEIEDAEALVTDDMEEDLTNWHEDASPENLAEYLADKSED